METPSGIFGGELAIIPSLRAGKRCWRSDRGDRENKSKRAQYCGLLDFAGEPTLLACFWHSTLIRTPANLFSHVFNH